MDRKPADTSACPPSNTAPLGEQNGLPSTGKPFSSRASALSGVDQPGACPKKIHEWTDRANISFEYTKKKIDDLIKKAKKKMAKKLDCNQLECTQCNDSFPGESELRKHYHSEEHLAKVREKSESKTKGDLTTFARERQSILSRIFGPPAHHVPLQGQTATSLQSDQPSSPAAANEQVVNPIDFADIFADDGSTKCPLSPLDPTLFPMGKETDSKKDDPDDMNIDWLHDKTDQATDITKPQVKVDLKAERLQRENGDLKEENRKLKEENRKMRERLEQIELEMSPKCLQNMVVELKKDELGYKFENNVFYRTMDVLEEQYSSVRELVANLVTCSFKINRGVVYDTSRSSEEDEAPKKRKKASNIQKEEEDG